MLQYDMREKRTDMKYGGSDRGHAHLNNFPNKQHKKAVITILVII